MGNAVTELFTMAVPHLNAAIVPISIHGGNEVVANGPGYNVPKRELVSVTQALLQTVSIRSVLTTAPTSKTHSNNSESLLSAS